MIASSRSRTRAPASVLRRMRIGRRRLSSHRSKTVKVEGSFWYFAVKRRKTTDKNGPLVIVFSGLRRFLIVGHDRLESVGLPPAGRAAYRAGKTARKKFSE